jgi:hypothetical protein
LYLAGLRGPKAVRSRVLRPHFLTQYNADRILLELQASFLPYAAFWDESKLSPHITLNKLEKGVLQAHENLKSIQMA